MSCVGVLQKLPGERVIVSVDFAAAMMTGDSISGATAAGSGTLSVEILGFTSSAVTAAISGGAGGVVPVIFSVTTGFGEVLQAVLSVSLTGCC